MGRPSGPPHRLIATFLSLRDGRSTSAPKITENFFFLNLKRHVIISCHHCGAELLPPSLFKVDYYYSNVSCFIFTSWASVKQMRLIKKNDSKRILLIC